MSETTIRDLNCIRRIQKGVTVKKAMSMVIAVVMLMSGQAEASLIGTSFDFTMDTKLPIINLFSHAGAHQYGFQESFSSLPPTAGTNLTLNSNATLLPPPLPVFAGFDNRVRLDLTELLYASFNVSQQLTGILALSGLAEQVDLASVSVFAGSVNVGTNVTASGPNGFGVQWDKNAVLVGLGLSAPIPLGDPQPTIMLDLAWNSVPAPGALGMFGVWGVMTGLGRRRDR